MDLTSYDGLKEAIQEHLDRDDLEDFIDGFIDLAEDLHKLAPDKDNPARGGIRFRGMLRRSQATLATTSRYLALPDGFLQMNVLRFAAARQGKLTEVTLDGIDEHRSDLAGRPSFYAVHEEIEFERKPSEATAIEMIYYAALTPLSADNASNALLALAAGAYLYAALAAAEPFLANDARIPVWKNEYGTIAQGLNNQRVSLAGPLAARIAGTVR